jgi:hypothetical protein
LWCVTAELDEQASLTWSTLHGDEALYVRRGELEIDGRTCPAEGVAVIEAGVRAEVVAKGPTEIVHFGATDVVRPSDGWYGAPDSGATVHVFGPEAKVRTQDEIRDTRIYADSSCKTCRLTLFYTARRGFYRSPGHSHSQDELIHILWGDIHVGRRHLTPGDTVAIAADVRYGFRSGEDGFGFLNYRRDVSHLTLALGSTPMLEGGEGLRVGDDA